MGGAMKRRGGKLENKERKQRGEVGRKDEEGM
jgi:hypothetical protein